MINIPRPTKYKRKSLLNHTNIQKLTGIKVYYVMIDSINTFYFVSRSQDFITLAHSTPVDVSYTVGSVFSCGQLSGIVISIDEQAYEVTIKTSYASRITEALEIDGGVLYGYFFSGYDYKSIDFSTMDVVLNSTRTSAAKFQGHREVQYFVNSANQELEDVDGDFESILTRPEVVIEIENRDQWRSSLRTQDQLNAMIGSEYHEFNSLLLPAIPQSDTYSYRNGLFVGDLTFKIY